MLPEPLLPLRRIANNLWWSWHEAARSLWEDLDPWLWQRCRQNPVAMLEDVDPARLAAMAADHDFVRRVHDVDRALTAELARPQRSCPRIAYFSMEFGLHESLRVYSGGLGILAGDHLRSASDLAVPMVGITLLYRHGYFRQVIDDGRQTEAYPPSLLDRTPLSRCLDADGAPLTVDVPYNGRFVRVAGWQLDVGRVRLYLLDTDVDGNTKTDRELTQALYGGDHVTRIAQEMVLGFGGVALLRALGVDIDVFHLNEGHCAFVPLARIGASIAAGASYANALEQVRRSTVFTTHTPVPAGHDRFTVPEVQDALGHWRTTVGISQDVLMDLGRERPGDANESLCMTVLALRTSRATNGVSRIHGRVSRQMFRAMWADRAVDDVPIGHITNGVHPVFWTSREARLLWDEVCPGWRERPWDPSVWAGVDRIPGEQIWALRCALRRRLVEQVAQRSGCHLDPMALTLGFARRFAPYKRGDMLFTDPDRLAALLSGPHPVQVVFAGKAHPRDDRGKALVRQVLRWADAYRFRNRIAFVEDYDIATGRLLTAGSDVWLNNPRRPNEACGTSGQKVPFNAGINLSTLDGWWPEAYDGSNGWAIGDDREDEASADAHDAKCLYELLENEVLPEWSRRDAAGIPVDWIARIRRSIRSCAPAFNSHRMMIEYVDGMYAPRTR